MSSPAHTPGTSGARVVGHAVVDGTAIVTISRADKSNALRAADKRAVADEIETASSRPDVRAIVVTGEGQRAFCAGSDIDEMRQFGVAEMHSMLEDERAMYRSVLESPKPVVAAVNGYALGAGLILAMVTDYAVAASSAQLGTPELTIGVAAPLEGFLLPYLVGLGRARQLFFLGERIDAQEARRIGLLNAVASPDEVLPRATEVAARIGALPGTGFAVQKRILNQLLSHGDLESAIAESHHATSLQFANESTGQAMTEFLARRTRRRD